MSFIDDFVAELAIAGQWTDITDDVLGDPGVTITRGAADENSDPEPARCELQLKNTAAAKYSPRNPVGIYFGQIGRNQPLRFSRRVARDQFGGRTVSSGLGTADLGGAWSLIGTAGNFAVAGGNAQITISSTVSERVAYQAGQLYRDVDVAVTVSGAPANVTGGSLDIGCIILGGTSTSAYFIVTLQVSTAEVLSMKITHADGSTIYGTTTITGITWTGAPVRIRAQVDGNTIRGKAWLASAKEPYDWVVEAETVTLASRLVPKGWVGIRAGVNSGNTNIPVTFQFDDWEVRSNRFFGEVSTWPNSWDLNGEDIRTKMVASANTRRLAQGEAPQQSTYRRGNEKGISPKHLAYWPVEDAAGSTQIASGMGGFPMLITGAGMPVFAANSDFPGSAPIGQPKGSAWFGRVPLVAATGQLQGVFLASVPSTGENDGATFLQLQCTGGTVGFADLSYRTGGNLQLKLYNQGRVLVYTSANVPFGLDGAPAQVSLELTQSGADINWAIATLQPGQSTGSVITGTATALTFGSCYGIGAPPYRGSVVNSAVGHYVVRNSITSIYTLANQLKAWAGEVASARIRRLCGENSVPVAVIADTDGVSAAMGAQKVDGLMTLIQDAADVDMGTLIDSRSKLALVYRQRNAFYNQAAALSLTYQQLYLPFEPAEDDRFLRNAVTVQRVDGTTFEATKTSGPLAVTDPASTTGVGRYDTEVQLNLASDEQVRDSAYWLLNLGTVNEPRYPEVRAQVAPQPPTTQLALDALSVDIGHRIAITSVPAGLGFDDISQIARGYTETCDGVEHWITFNVSPESPYQVMQLDGTDASRVDLDDNYLAQAVTSTAATLVVGSTGGVGWTTDPADWPIPLRLGGETVSATAVANENLANVGFESTLTPWTASGTSGFTQSGTQKHSGSFAARLVPTGAAARASVSSELLPVVAGQPVTVSGWMWCTSAVTSNASIGISWYDSASGFLSESHNFVSVSAATWTQFVNALTVPAGAAFAQVVATIGGTPAAAQVFYVDDLSFTGPQRLTVTRSVNGVVKAQPAGVQVGLARPAIAAL